VWQTLQPEYPDEQIFEMNADGSGKRLISTGKGRCTCSYFSPDGKWIYFSSTHATAPGPQPPVDKSKGYVWMVNPNFAMYRTPEKPMENRTWQPVLDEHSYVAETTIAPNGKYMAFTSDFEGDLEVYRAKLDGTDVRRLTHEIGYDGGPFVSWDSKWIVYRRQAVTNDQERQDYLDLLAKHLVRPTSLEIWIMDADGENKHQITHLGAASFAPFLAPDDKHVIFSSNYGDPKGREFDLFMTDLDGNHMQRITTAPEFDGFPMFSRDGKKLVWCSNRYGKVKGETNIFVADWVK
jgi:Tol biopolymer transport system component